MLNYWLHFNLWKNWRDIRIVIEVLAITTQINIRAVFFIHILLLLRRLYELFNGFPLMIEAYFYSSFRFLWVSLLQNVLASTFIWFREFLIRALFYGRFDFLLQPFLVDEITERNAGLLFLRLIWIFIGWIFKLRIYLVVLIVVLMPFF